jgi:sugar phosphate isomerase/epimerase
MSLEDFIDFCAEQDLDGVELTSYFFPRTDVEYLCALKRRAFANGLAITGTPVSNDFCLPPGEKREGQLQHVRDWVDRAAILGAPCIRVFGGQTPPGHSETEARAWCVEGLKEACAYAGTKGIVLALENHGGITVTAEQVLGLVRAVHSPWIGLNLDTGNFRDPDPYEAIEKTAPAAVVVQIKVELVVAGKKQPADLGRIIEILRRSGFRGVIALEYEAAEDPLVAVPRYLAELKRLVRG